MRWNVNIIIVNILNYSLENDNRIRRSSRLENDHRLGTSNRGKTIGLQGTELRLKFNRKKSTLLISTQKYFKVVFVTYYFDRQHPSYSLSRISNQFLKENVGMKCVYVWACTCQLVYRRRCEKHTSKHGRHFGSELVDRAHGYACVLVLHAIHQLFHLCEHDEHTQQLNVEHESKGSTTLTFL